MILGFQVILTFKLSQHSRDKQLMISLIEYLGCGNVYNDSNLVQFIINKYKDLNNKVIQFFDKYNIIGVKLQDYQDFKKIIELIKNGDHLTTEGLEKIRKLILNMNKNRILP
jgi:hypothetical protein